MELFMKYLPFLLLFFSLSVFGETAQECAKLVRTDDRLACFDKLFPSKTDKMIESETVQKKQPSADTRMSRIGQQGKLPRQLKTN